METARLDIAYKSMLVGACLLASLWSSQCEGGDYVVSKKDSHTIEACPEHTVAENAIKA